MFKDSTVRRLFRLGRPAEHYPRAKSVLVVGLGRFGAAAANTLTDLGVEVLGIDLDPILIHHWADRLAHVRIADGTCAATLNELGAAECDAAVVAIGRNLEANILSTKVLVEIGVANIWAKASSARHASILQKIGAHKVIQPEQEVGERIGHVIRSEGAREFDNATEFVLADLSVPASLAGLTLQDAEIRRWFGVTVICVSSSTGEYIFARSDVRLCLGDSVLIAGTVDHVERFAMLR